MTNKNFKSQIQAFLRTQKYKCQLGCTSSLSNYKTQVKEMINECVNFFEDLFIPFQALLIQNFNLDSVFQDLGGQTKFICS
jgi:hypothetical protein